MRGKKISLVWVLMFRKASVGKQMDPLSLNEKMLNLNVILLDSQRGHCMGIQKDITSPMKEALSCFLPAGPLPVSTHMAHLSLFPSPFPTFSLFLWEQLLSGCEGLERLWVDICRSCALSLKPLVWATQRPQFMALYSSAVAKRSPGAQFPSPSNSF